MRNIFLAVSVFLLSACVSTVYTPPPLDPLETEKVRQNLQQEAIEYQLARRARMYDLAWPLLVSNTDFCAKNKPSIGVVLADLEAYADYVGGIKKEQLLQLGFADELQVLHVMAGGPADKAGLKTGDKLLAVNGEVVEDNSPTLVVKAISQSVKEDKNVNIQIKRVGETQTLEIESVDACDVPVKLSSSSSINAMATNSTIIINAGLMRAGTDDMIQHIIAHELAHVTLKHPKKVIYNSIVSGAFLYGPVLYAGGSVTDRVLKMTGSKRKGSLALRALAISAPYGDEFESEADYLGLYMWARAGGNLDSASDIFELFGRESPGSTWLRYTHPMSPERIIAAKRTVSEIKALQKAGQPLEPGKR